MREAPQKPAWKEKILKQKTQKDIKSSPHFLEFCINLVTSNGIVYHVAFLEYASLTMASTHFLTRLKDSNLLTAQSHWKHIAVVCLPAELLFSHESRKLRSWGYSGWPLSRQKKKGEWAFAVRTQKPLERRDFIDLNWTSRGSVHPPTSSTNKMPRVKDS